MDSALLHIHHVGIIADGFDTYFEFHKKLAELLKRPSTKSLKTHADEAVAAITSEVRRFVPDAGSAGDSPKEVVLRLLYGVDELITAMTHGGHGLTDDEKKAREREAAAKVAVAAYLAQQAVTEGGG